VGQAPRRVLALARVSSADQEARGTSLDAQQKKAEIQALEERIAKLS